MRYDPDKRLYHPQEPGEDIADYKARKSHVMALGVERRMECEPAPGQEPDECLRRVFGILPPGFCGTPWLS